MYKEIVDFTNAHKVSYAQGNDLKYATAVKIANTNQYGWYEHETPTLKSKINTYLDFNNFNPLNDQKCLKSGRSWKQIAWSNKYSNFDKQNISLIQDFPSLDNKKASVSFGNKSNNNFNTSHFYFNRSGGNHCEIERKNIPFLGKKYNVSFWMKTSNSVHSDAFQFYQNNQLFPFSDNFAMRSGNNLASNKLILQLIPTSTNEATIFLQQIFSDYAVSRYKSYWFNGVTFNIPINSWIFINVSINDNKMSVAYNKEIATTKQFRQEDVKFAKLLINKKISRKSKWKNIDAGRQYNFNDVNDKNRVHGLGIKSNSLAVSDFRTYSDVFVSSSNDPFLSHIQNHREQVGDIPHGFDNNSLKNAKSKQVDLQFDNPMTEPSFMTSILNSEFKITNESEYISYLQELQLREKQDDDFIENMMHYDSLFEIDFNTIKDLG